MFATHPSPPYLGRECCVIVRSAMTKQPDCNKEWIAAKIRDFLAMTLRDILLQ